MQLRWSHIQRRMRGERFRQVQMQCLVPNTLLCQSWILEEAECRPIPECSRLAPSKAAIVCVSSLPALRIVRSSHRPVSPLVPAAQASSGLVRVPSGWIPFFPCQWLQSVYSHGGLPFPPSLPAHTCTTAMSSVSTSPPAVTTASASSPPLQTHRASTAWRVGSVPGSRLLLLTPDRREGRVLPGKPTWILRVRLYSSRTAEPLRDILNIHELGRNLILVALSFSTL